MNQQIDFIKYDVDEQEQTITYSCASDTPYTRWDEEKKVAYDEVLVINEESVDMSRLKAGANVLYGHDTMNIIGVVEDAYIIGNKLFVKVRFSKNDPFAVRIYRDILDGIIKNVSIGYQVLAYRDEREGGRIVRYVTRFQIFETSIVSVPADDTVGVRSLKLKEHKMSKKSKKDEDVKPEEQEVKEAEAAETEEQKEAETEEQEVKAAEEEKKEAVEDTEVKEDETEKEEKGCDGKPEEKSAEVDELKREVEALKAQVKALENPPTENLPVDASAKNEEAAEIRASGAALGVSEEEQEKAIKSGMTARDFKRKYRELNNLTIKQEERHMKLQEYFREGNFNDKFVLNQRSYTGFGGQEGEGGASAIGTETKPLIAALEKVMGVKGYRTMTGLTSNISIPVQTGRNTIYQTDHLRDAATASAPALTPVTLSPVKLSGNTRIGKELLVQANDDIEAFVVDSLTKEIAYKVEDYLLGKVKTGAAGSVTYSALSAIDWDDVLAFEAQVGGFALQTPAYVMSPAARAALKGIPKAANYPEFLCSGFNEINGYQCNVSGVVGNDDIYFGDWSKLLLGIWGEGLEIMVNPYTYAKEGDVEIVASLCIDAAVLQGDAFVVGAVEEESSSSN